VATGYTNTHAEATKAIQIIQLKARTVTYRTSSPVEGRRIIQLWRSNGPYCNLKKNNISQCFHLQASEAARKAKIVTGGRQLGGGRVLAPVDRSKSTDLLRVRTLCLFFFFGIHFYIPHVYLGHRSGHPKVVLSKNIVVGRACAAV
jgi:hypothetical protein